MRKKFYISPPEVKYLVSVLLYEKTEAHLIQGDSSERLSQILIEHHQQFAIDRYYDIGREMLDEFMENHLLRLDKHIEKLPATVELTEENKYNFFTYYGIASILLNREDEESGLYYLVTESDPIVL